MAASGAGKEKEKHVSSFCVAACRRRTRRSDSDVRRGGRRREGRLRLREGVEEGGVVGAEHFQSVRGSSGLGRWGSVGGRRWSDCSGVGARRSVKGVHGMKQAGILAMAK